MLVGVDEVEVAKVEDEDEEFVVALDELDVLVLVLLDEDAAVFEASEASIDVTSV